MATVHANSDNLTRAPTVGFIMREVFFMQKIFDHFVLRNLHENETGWDPGGTGGTLGGNSNFFTKLIENETADRNYRSEQERGAPRAVAISLQFTFSSRF
jgi:hypothetical protein